MLRSKPVRDSRYINALTTAVISTRILLRNSSPEDKLEYKAHPERYKLRYLYREFHLKFSEMKLYSMPKGSVNFNFRDFSPHILGLCLTYMVNVGLSSRATQRALLEIHGVKISHVTVSKYAQDCRCNCSAFLWILMITSRLPTLLLMKPMSR